EFAVRVEALDAVVVMVGDKHLVGTVDGDIDRKMKVAGGSTLLAPLKQEARRRRFRLGSIEVLAPRRAATRQRRGRKTDKRAAARRLDERFGPDVGGSHAGIPSQRWELGKACLAARRCQRDKISNKHSV